MAACLAAAVFFGLLGDDFGACLKGDFEYRFLGLLTCLSLPCLPVDSNWRTAGSPLLLF